MVSMGRTLPHSLEAEENLLACCFIDGLDVLPKCREFAITPERLYDPKHGILLEVMFELYDRGTPVAIDIVAVELEKRRQLDAIGGYPFLTQVSSRVPTTAQATFFIERVREQAILREIIRSCTGAVEDCYNFSGDLDDFVDQVEKKIFSVTQMRVLDRLRPAAKIVPEALNNLTGMITRKGELTGIPTGYKDLDALLWGFQPADLIILAARPSMGKTSLALNIAENVSAPERGGKAKPVLVFSLEMTGTQLMQRLLCSRSRVNMKLLRGGLFSKGGDETSRLLFAADQMSRAPMFVDDSSSITVSTIRARARRIHAREPLGLIVVDYLQLIAGNSRIPREQQISEASRGLKALAKELNVPTLVLSQLNRSVEKENRSPRLSDLRESGAIEQDADVVLMMARPLDSDDKFQVAADSTDLIVAKQRNGPVGTLKLTFLADITRFENHHV